MQLRLRPPRAADQVRFLEAARRSRTLHRPWVHPPLCHEDFRDFVRQADSEFRKTFLVVDSHDDLVGMVAVTGIARGLLQSAYLGYYALLPHAGRGCMTVALATVLSHAFGPLRLHRLEANIQPENLASRALVQRLGFTLEGYSKRYLKIGGRWRDHERWALLCEDWPSHDRRVRAASSHRCALVQASPKPQRT